MTYDQGTYDQDQIDIGSEINEQELRHPTFVNLDDVLVAEVDDDTGTIVVDMRHPTFVNFDLDEPDDLALVGAIVARCGWEIDDLATPAHVATLVDQDREGLARTVRDIDKMLLLLGTIRDEAAQALAAMMVDDHEAIAGLSVSRSRSIKTEWDRDGTWRAVRGTIVDRWARDGEAVDTGKAELIDRALADVKTAHNALTPSVTGLKALAIDANEYRSTTRSDRFSVTVK